MTVKLEKLLKMAEQISANISYSDDRELVANKIADHLNRFWDPRMKASICEYAASEDNTLTDPLRLAISKLAALSKQAL